MPRRSSRRRGVRSAAAFPPRRQLTTAGVDTAAFRVIEAVDGQAFLTLPPLHGANTPPEIRGDFLPRVEPRLVLGPSFGTRGHAGVEDSAPVRHYAPLSLRRLVALEPRCTARETAGASSFRLVGERHKEDSMTTHRKIVICSRRCRWSLPMMAGRSAAPSAAEPNAAFEGFGEPSRSSCRGRRSHVQARSDARHLPRPALQPRRGACRTAAAAPGRPGDASADQLRAAWGPFVAEAGTFELSGTTSSRCGRRSRRIPRRCEKERHQRLHLPAPGRHVDADRGPHACGPSAQPITVTLTRVE